MSVANLNPAEIAPSIVGDQERLFLVEGIGQNPQKVAEKAWQYINLAELLPVQCGG